LAASNVVRGFLYGRPHAALIYPKVVNMNRKIHIDTLTRELCAFALPMLLGNILQSCYNLADMAVVGSFVGREALAAVSNTSMICFISNSICIGFTAGGNVLVAKFRGARDAAAQRDTIRSLFALSSAGGVMLTVINYLLYVPILQLMNTPSEAMPYATEYMGVICAGNFFVFGYNAVCSVMRGLGDSRRPLYFVAVTAAVNIALDYVLVVFFHWGVRGAAIATVLAQAVSCMVALWTLHKQGQKDPSFVFHFDRRSLAVDRPLCCELLRIGLPTAFRSAALNLSYLVVTSLFNGYGTAAAAAAGIGLKVNTFVAMPSWAVGQAVSIMAGHSMGANDPDRASKTARKGIMTSLLFNGVLLCLIQIFVRQLLGIFTADAEVIRLGILYLRIACSVNFIPYVVMNLLDNFATGVGAPFVALFNTLLHSVVVRLGLSLLLTAWLPYGFMGLCIAESVSPVIPCCVGIVFFLKGRWREQRMPVIGQ
jgi:putative MATE family efflux protein